MNMNIGAEEEKIKKLHSEMGKLLYDVYQDGEQINEDIIPFCEKIDVIYGTIEEMKTKILELRNVKACAECGHELEMEMAFCYKCGRKQEADVVDTGEDIPECKDKTMYNQG